MELYEAYLQEIIERSKLGLGPKPIDQGDLLEEIINIILEPNSPNRNDAVKHFIYNTLPGTTGAASVKAKFLKKLILKSELLDEIDQNYAFELLSHMKGGPSVEVLLDLAFHEDVMIAQQAASQITMVSDPRVASQSQDHDPRCARRAWPLRKIYQTTNAPW